MRLGRRAVLAGAAAAAGLAGIGVATFRARASPRGVVAPTAVAVRATPITALSSPEPDRTRFGELTFRSGLVLASDHPGFGGWSGLCRSPDGASIVALSDNAGWLTADVTSADGRLTGLAGAVLAPVLGVDGRPLWQGAAYDSECLAIANGVAYVGIERVHAVMRFEWARDGVGARGVELPIPPDVRTLPSNAGLEALALAPEGHPIAGRLVAVAEQARGGSDTPTRGWVLTGGEPYAFDVARSDDFSITDMAFLPSGELLLLERHYSLGRGVACRMRRVAADAIRPGATLDGRVIFEADLGYAIDNMEALALHPGRSGETIVTLLSDDNFALHQRTIRLEFALGS